MYLLVKVKHQLATQHQTKTDQEKSSPPVTFSDIAATLFGSAGSYAVDAALIFTQFGFCCAYYIFIVQNSILFFSSWNLSYGVWVVIWLPLLIGLSWMRTLKSISWVTAAANICILGSIIVILAGCTLELSENGIAGTIDESTGSGDEGASEPPSIEYWVIPQTFAIMLGTAVYAYEGIGVVIPCETSMRQPERFSRVLFAVMGFSIVNYCIFGLIPYLTFGSDTSDVITENMHALSSQSSTWLVLSYMVQVALVLAIIGTYPMQLFVVIDILEEW
eukprot:CAMPEP_0201561298 /NCGR_PEP_ID=MMETSP0173_2-20130828/78726_1 /ASSEMBLY_ACC=CAM_ASM_000268 /TAXON_ID=218659 /ORGANISM="Vexillifera sp., Strain DIVA3 564/2" /LENGTH=275 /DNA_ID=CAMNT_0047975797 /DNA_START=112 /DNA_END=936 /DNA_ORIENTATION=-